MDQEQNQSRREFITKLGAIMGIGALSTISPLAVNNAFAYKRSLTTVKRAGKLFSEHQMKVLASVCQAIIPKTDTPGAGDLDCHGFIDHQLLAVHSKQEQQEVVSVVDVIDSSSQSKFNKSFIDISSEQQAEILISIEQQGSVNSQRFKQLKSLNAFGYFTSDVGATQVLNYQPVPGGYVASIPMTENTKNYGSLAYY